MRNARDQDQDRNKYLFPRDLFEAPADPSGTLWTCVRSKPRHEKKLCEFLHLQRIAHYLPLTIKYTYSGRKLRRALHPLFPGYVFVKGHHAKNSFKDSRRVTYILKPASPIQARALDSQIRAVHHLLAEDMPVELSTQCQIGERLTVTSGPLQGLSGTVIAQANAKRLVVWVDMLGVGVSVVLGSETRVARAGTASQKLQ